MRDPDVTVELPDDAPALMWRNVTGQVAAELGKLVGVPAEQLTPPPREEGNTLRIWRVAAVPRVPDHRAMLALWVVNGPFHPFWSWWMIGLSHLRHIDGVPPAHLHYAGAEYELLIVSLDPEKSPPDVDAAEDFRGGALLEASAILSPADLVYQFDGVTDEQAVRIVEAGVRAIERGELSPDSDFAALWRKCLDVTIDHYRRGIHT